MEATTNIAVRQSSRAQRGAATVGIALLVVLLMGAALSTALSLSGSVARDAASADQQVQALFIAESGMERATQRFAAGEACGSLGNGSTSFPMGTAGSFIINPGTNTLFDGVTSSGTSCRVRVTGKTAVGQVTRVIESIIAPVATAPVATASDAIATYTCTVPPDSNLLIVSVSWTTPAASTLSITRVTFKDAADQDHDMDLVAPPVRRADASKRVSAQNFLLRAPKVGNKINGTVSMNGTPLGAIVGCTALAGVDLTDPNRNPIDTVASACGNGPPFGVTIKTGATNSGYVIDNLVRDKTGNMNMVTASGREQTWEFHSSNSAGSGSYRGPLAASTQASMSWTWNKNKIWAIAALAVRADMAVGGGERVSFTGGGGGGGGDEDEDEDEDSGGGGAGCEGVTGWREVIMPPS